MVKDLSDPGSPQDISEVLNRQNINIDILINNAGIGDFGEFHQASWERQQKMIQLNITSLTHLTHLLLPGMVDRGKGKILNVASTAAFQPGPWMSVYYASKSYVLNFTEAIAEEMRGTGVTATALCPGPTATAFEQEAEMEDSPLFKNLSVMQPEKVAHIGYKAMQKGKVVAIPGFINKTLVQSIRITPRAMMRKMVRKLQAGKWGSGVNS